jgi:hypothetical protein
MRGHDLDGVSCIPGPGGEYQPVTAEARRVGDATRRGELDLLRALVVVGLVCFHTAVISAPASFR